MEDTTKQAAATLIVVSAYFVMLWIAVFLLNVAPDRALVLSLITLGLIGSGILYTASTLRRGRDES